MTSSFWWQCDDHMMTKTTALCNDSSSSEELTASFSRSSRRVTPESKSLSYCECPCVYLAFSSREERISTVQDVQANGKYPESSDQINGS